MPIATQSPQVDGHDEHTDLANLREHLIAVGVHGYSPALSRAMQALGCSNEHETMLALIDELLQRLGVHSADHGADHAAEPAA